MTVEAANPITTYTVSGTGPYAIPWPYIAGAIRVAVATNGIYDDLAASDVTILPSSGPTGNVTLSAAAAATHAGKPMLVLRDTPIEQGWEAQVGAREAGLEAQLDEMTQGLQELSRDMASTLRVAGGAQPIIAMPENHVPIWDGEKFVPGPTAAEITDAQQNAQTASAAASMVMAGSPYGYASRTQMLNDDLGYTAAAGTQVTVGQRIFAGYRWYVVAASTATNHDFTAVGGAKINEVGPDYSTRAIAARAVTRGDRVANDVVTVGSDRYIVDAFGIDGLVQTNMDFSGTLGAIGTRCFLGDAVKFAVFGDSTVEGAATSGGSANPVDANGDAIGTTSQNTRAPNSWPVKLQENLRAMFANNAIVVWNAGYGGKTVYFGWAGSNYAAAVLNNPAYGSPDYTLISFGLNDSVSAGYDGAIFERRLLALCDQIKRAGGVPIIVTSDVASQNTLRQGSALEKVIQSQRKIAAQISAPIIDMNTMETEFYGAPRANARFAFDQPDGLHFTNNGHALKAAYAAAILFPNTLFLDGQEDIAVPAWSKHCNTAGLSYGVADAINNRFDASMNVFSGTYSTGQALLDLWVWHTNQDQTCFWRSIDGDGYYHPRTLADAPEITYTHVITGGTATVKSATAGQLIGPAGKRLSEVPVRVTDVFRAGLARFRFFAPKDTAANNVSLGYFHFRKPMKRQIAFEMPTLTGNRYFMLDDFEATHDLIGFGVGRKIDMLLETALPNGTGIMLWGGRRFTGTSFTVDNAHRAIFLYRNDAAGGTVGLFECDFLGDTTGSLEASRGSAAFAWPDVALFRIRAEMDASGNATLTVFNGWTSTTSLITYTVSRGTAQMVLGGRILPGIFRNFSLAGGSIVAASAIIAN